MCLLDAICSQQKPIKNRSTLTDFSLNLSFHKAKFEILTPMDSLLSKQATFATDLVIRFGDLSLTKYLY